MSKHLEKRYRRYYAVLNIPKDVQGLVGNSPNATKFLKSLGTESRTEAERLAKPYVAKWQAEIAAARSGSNEPLQRLIVEHRHMYETADYSRDATLNPIDVIEDIVRDQAMELDAKNPGDGARYFNEVTGRKTPTSSHMEQWLASLGDVEKTKDMKRSELVKFAKPFSFLEDITKKAVKEWAVGLMNDDGLSLKTVNRKLSFLRSYWDYLTSIEIVSDDNRPLHDLKLAGKAAKNTKADETKPLRPATILACLQEAKAKGDDQLYDLITLAMWTGARIEELCSLQIAEVGEWSFTIKDAKTPSGWREVPIHSKLKPTMEQLVAASSDGYVLSGLKPNKYGDRSNAIGKRFGHMKRAMGLKSRQETFHSIRKTVATQLENAGVPESVAADILGHDKPTVTYGLYSGGASLETKREAIEKLDFSVAL